MNVRLALIGALLAPAGIAQDDTTELPRRRVFGEVRATEGAPWLGATVHLLSRPIPGDERVGEADHLQVTPDERGRFRAEVLTGRPYTVWAVESSADTYRISAAVEDVFPTVPVQLREAGEPRPYRRLEIQVDAWQHRAPLVFHLASNTDNVLTQRGLLDADGTLALPAWPGKSIEFEVLDAAGVPVHVRSIDFADDNAAIELPEPREIGLVITEAATGHGVGGAKVCVRLRGQLHRLGVTDANGRVALHTGLTKLKLYAIPPDDSELGVGFIRTAGSGHEPEAPPEMRPGVKADYHGSLDQGTIASGQILLRPGVPAANMQLLLLGPAIHKREKSASLTEVSRLVTTDADGKFRVPGCYDDATLLAVLSEQHIAALPKDWRRGLHPVVYLPANGEDGAISLVDLRPLEFRTRTPDGVPADRPRLAFVNLQCREHLRSTTFRARGDRAGRLRLLMPAADSIAVSIRHADSWLMRSLLIEGSPGVAAELPVRLPQPCHVRGTLTIAGTGPVSGRLLCYPDPRQPRGGPLGPALEPEPGATGARLTRLPSPSDALRTYHAVAGLRHVSTGDDGKFDVVVPSIWLPYYITANEAGRRAKLRFPLEAQTVEGLEVELQ